MLDFESVSQVVPPSLSLKYLFVTSGLAFVFGLYPGACFSTVPKLFGRISGDIILFVSSRLMLLEARNLAIILILIPVTTYEKTSYTESAGRSFKNGF